MKVAITNVGNCFGVSYKNPDKDKIDDLFAIVEVGIEGNNKGAISIVHTNKPSVFFHHGDYEFSKEMYGNFQHKYGFGKIFEAGCKVWDKKNNISHMCYFNGGDFTNEWGRKAVVGGFVDFLNRIVQFESLNDYMAYEEAHKEEEWENKDVCDKIVELAKVIELYKKYHEINRALSITHDMEDLINRRLRSLLKDNENHKQQ